MYNVKSMVKKSKLILCGLILLAQLFQSFSLDISAADIPVTKTEAEMGDYLKEMGVFKGSNNGLELDRSPTRLEGLIMFIRMLGKEDEALTYTGKSPFTDVQDWAKSYVAWAYNMNYIKGTSPTTFGNGEIDAKSFMTLVLRAMGYNDSTGDFSWNSAMTFAATNEIVPSDVLTTMQNSTHFDRGNVAQIVYYSLDAKMKDGVILKTKLNLAKPTEAEAEEELDLSIIKKSTVLINNDSVQVKPSLTSQYGGSVTIDFSKKERVRLNGTEIEKTNYIAASIHVGELPSDIVGKIAYLDQALMMTNYGDTTGDYYTYDIVPLTDDVLYNLMVNRNSDEPLELSQENSLNNLATRDLDEFGPFNFYYLILLDQSMSPLGIICTGKPAFGSNSARFIKYDPTEAEIATRPYSEYLRSYRESIQLTSLYGAEIFAGDLTNTGYGQLQYVSGFFPKTLTGQYIKKDGSFSYLLEADDIRSFEQIKQTISPPSTYTDWKYFETRDYTDKTIIYNEFPGINYYLDLNADLTRQKEILNYIDAEDRSIFAAEKIGREYCSPLSSKEVFIKIHIKNATKGWQESFRKNAYLMLFSGEHRFQVNSWDVLDENGTVVRTSIGDISHFVVNRAGVESSIRYYDYLFNKSNPDTEVDLVIGPLHIDSATSKMGFVLPTDMEATYEFVKGDQQ